MWFPIADLGAPTLERVRPVFSELRDRVEAGDTLLMHCGAGIGRAGTIAAGLLITMGVRRERALELVALHRPMAGPEAGAQSELLEALDTR
jgi:protein-tyrosine phosphatase